MLLMRQSIFLNNGRVNTFAMFRSVRYEVMRLILRFWRRIRVKKLLFEVGWVAMAFCWGHVFYGNVNNGSYLYILYNVALPQVQEFFNTQFENVVFNLYDGCRIELWYKRFWQ